jgi:hypothetical protein
MRQIEKLSFTGITPRRMDAIRARGKAEGLVLDGQKGLVTWDHGIGIDWSYDEEKETLHIQAAIPFGVTENEVEGAISAIVRKTAVEYPLVDATAPVRQITRDERLARAALESEQPGRYAKPELAADEEPLLHPAVGAHVVVEGTLPDGTHEVVVEKEPVPA